MNTRLLRLAHRYRNGRRDWAVPGYGNPVSLLPPSGEGRMAWGWTLRWPGRDAKGEYVRGVDLDRHRALARNEIRRLLATIEEKPAKEHI